MKKYSFLIFILIYSLDASSQDFGFFGIGYNASFLSADNFDFVVDQYNDSRTYLDNEMNYPHYQDGLAIRIGGGFYGAFIDFGYSGRSAKVSASGTDVSGTVQQRDLKSKFNSLDIGLGFNLMTDELIISIGLNTAFGNEKTETRVGELSEISNQDYEEIDKSLEVAFEPFIQFTISSNGKSAFILKPYYHFRVIEVDYADVNRAINPVTSGSDPYILDGNQNGFGITVMIGFGNFE